MRLLCRGTAELHDVLRGLKSEAGAGHTATRVVLDESVPLRPRLR